MTRSRCVKRVLPGLQDPVLDSQKIFQAALEAVSHPGRPVGVLVALQAPAALATASAAFLLTMADSETPIWLQEDDDAVCEYLRSHCNARFVEDCREARFALITAPGKMPSLSAFDPGDPEYPDRSATVLIQVAQARSGSGVHLSTPGIRGAAQLDLGGLPADFWPQWQRNADLFPCGVDVLFVSGSTLFAVPRSRSLSRSDGERRRLDLDAKPAAILQVRRRRCVIRVTVLSHSLTTLARTCALTL